MTTKKDALATTEPAGALAIPDWMKDDVEGQALDAQFESSELQLPQLKICQSMTPQRKRNDPTFIEGLEEGDLFNAASGQNYHTGPLPFVMLKRWVNYIKFFTQAEGGGIKSRCTLGADGLVRDEDGIVQNMGFGPKGEKPETTKFFNYLFYLVDSKEIVWYSAKSVALSVMRQYHSSLKAVKNVADFAKVFTIATAPDKDKAGHDYFKPVVPRLPHAIVVDKPLYDAIKKMVIDLKDKDVNTSAEEGGDDEAPAPRANRGTFDGDKPPF